MPIYEYLCNNCGEEFELLIRMGSDGGHCPRCGENRLQKKFSVFGMKSSSGFVSSSGSSCSGCSSHNCGGCKH